MKNKGREYDLTQMQIKLGIESIEIISLKADWLKSQVLQSIEVSQYHQYSKYEELALELLLEYGFIIFFLRLLFLKWNDLIENRAHNLIDQNQNE